MAKFFRSLLGIILIACGLGICYLSWPMFFQSQLVIVGFGVALSAFGVATVFGGIAILRGANVRDILLMLHLSS